ncbi:hypothetical protein BDW02DRAFT_613155 [Decorospora gaudefroyi]|uniref:Uncharacterized protein n=1 Tax=Decorospora gaudefroyi TaxID=184978 RepID=A0A6A5JWL9_9PLEO|nr:hypothetical protein BDW02DRAFT_613155 [Decorospora gaudefroyi]
MSGREPAFPTKSALSKRAREDEPEEPLKRQRQYEFQNSTGAPQQQQTATHHSHGTLTLPSPAVIAEFSNGSPVPFSASATQQTLFATQKQWLQNAAADLTGRPIITVPGIDPRLWSLGATQGANRILLAPRHIWRLRSLAPYKRYVAYSQMTWLARRMVEHDQASSQYQQYWKNIVALGARLMQVEQGWVASFTGTHAEKMHRFIWVRDLQAVPTPVDQSMVHEFHRYQAGMVWGPIATADKERQRPQPRAAANRETPASQTQKPLLIPQPEAGAQPRQNIKPDKIKHPGDAVSVPAYPFDSIEDYTADAKGRYQCRHDSDTGRKCCTEGLTKSGMKASIQKEISTWKAKVEVLIERGALNAAHMTWSIYQNARLRAKQRAEEMKVKSVKEKAESRAAAKRQQQQQEREQRQQQQPQRAYEQREQELLQYQHLLDAAAPTAPPPANLSSLSPIPAPQSTPSQCAPQAARADEKLKALKTHDRFQRQCSGKEAQKQWPNCARFNAWWEAKRLTIQEALLSPEQQSALNDPEPSGMPDKNPNFVKKTAVDVQKEVGAEATRGLDEAQVDGDELRDLFEDAE